MPRKEKGLASTGYDIRSTVLAAWRGGRVVAAWYGVVDANDNTEEVIEISKGELDSTIVFVYTARFNAWACGVAEWRSSSQSHTTRQRTRGPHRERASSAWIRDQCSSRIAPACARTTTKRARESERERQHQRCLVWFGRCSVSSHLCEAPDPSSSNYTSRGALASEARRRLLAAVVGGRCWASGG